MKSNKRSQSVELTCLKVEIDLAMKIGKANDFGYEIPNVGMQFVMVGKGNESKVGIQTSK